MNKNIQLATAITNYIDARFYELMAVREEGEDGYLSNPVQERKDRKKAPEELIKIIEEN